MSCSRWECRGCDRAEQFASGRERPSGSGLRDLLHPGGGDADHPAADADGRCALVDQSRHHAPDPDLDALSAQRAGTVDLPRADPRHNHLPPCPVGLDHAPDPRQWRCGRAGARLRQFRGVRQRRGRPRDLHDRGDRAVPGGDQGGRAHRGGQRPLHARCAAGQADVDRRRAAQRRHRRRRGAPSPQQPREGEPVLRRHGWRDALREGRCHRRPDHHRRQPARRTADRRDPARHALLGGGGDLHAADGG